MTISTVPPFYNMPFIDPKSDMLSSQALLYLDQVMAILNDVVNLLNLYVTSDFIAAVPKTTAEITALEPNSPLGAIWFNTSIAKLQVKTAAGTIETITST